MAFALSGCGGYYASYPVKYRNPPPAYPNPPSAYAPPAVVESAPQVAPEPAEPVRPWPSSGTARVETGDTLHRISRRYGVSPGDLARVNGLSRPDDIVPGRSLRLPPHRIHTVQRGETVYGLSRRYQIAQSDLVRLNAIQPPYRVAVGQRLKIPAPQAPQRTAEPETVVASLPSEASRSKMPSPQRQTVLQPQTREILRPQRSALRAAPPPPRPAGAFRWPLKGKILMGFGDRGKGLHNDGINIAAKKGAAVRAAENGVVAYSGNELRGFGNLILLKHAGGWTSAYAHNSRLLVRTGQRVRRGQVIARAGSSGSVKRPQLHFELRRGDTAVNPVKHLKTPRRRNQRISRASGPAGRRDPG